MQFSKNRGPLEVRQESDKCRDYLNNPLTEEELMSLRRPTAGSERHHSNNPGHVSSNFQNSVVPNMAHQGIHLPVGMIAPPNTSNMGINELTAQLAALAQQSGLALTPAAVAATASFMALTSQNSGPGAQSMSGTPNLSTILAALQGGAVQTGVLPHMSGGNTSVMGSVQTPVSSHVTPVGVRPPPNNNGSTVLIVSNLNEDVSVDFGMSRLWVCSKNMTSNLIFCFSFHVFLKSHHLLSTLGLYSLIGYTIMITHHCCQIGRFSSYFAVLVQSCCTLASVVRLYVILNSDSLF